MRYQLGGHTEHLVGARHLEIQDGADGASELPDVFVLNVAAILTQVRRDAIGARVLADTGCGNGIRLGTATRLSHGGHMINVDVQPLSPHASKCLWRS
jgi:hypothetical protein